MDEDFTNYKLVAGVAAFKGWSMQEVRRLCKDAKCLKVQKGTIIYDQGEPCRSFYVVRDGLLREEVAVELNSYHKHPLNQKAREVIITTTRFV